MSKPTTLGAAKHLAERTLTFGERLAGFWEFDPDADEVVVEMLEKISPRAGLDEARARLAVDIRDQLGHARSFSPDTDDAVRSRAARLPLPERPS